MDHALSREPRETQEQAAKKLFRELGGTVSMQAPETAADGKDEPERELQSKPETTRNGISSRDLLVHNGGATIIGEVSLSDLLIVDGNTIDVSTVSLSTKKELAGPKNKGADSVGPVLKAGTGKKEIPYTEWQTVYLTSDFTADPQLNRNGGTVGLRIGCRDKRRAHVAGLYLLQSGLINGLLHYKHVSPTNGAAWYFHFSEHRGLLQNSLAWQFTPARGFARLVRKNKYHVGWKHYHEVRARRGEDRHLPKLNETEDEAQVIHHAVVTEEGDDVSGMAFVTSPRGSSLLGSGSDNSSYNGEYVMQPGIINGMHWFALGALDNNKTIAIVYSAQTISGGGAFSFISMAEFHDAVRNNRTSPGWKYYFEALHRGDFEPPEPPTSWHQKWLKNVQSKLMKVEAGWGMCGLVGVALCIASEAARSVNSRRRLWRILSWISPFSKRARPPPPRDLRRKKANRLAGG
jgi:hypothetical protein